MLARIAQLLVHARPAFVALAVTIYAVSVSVVAFRWRTILGGIQPPGAPVPLRPLVLITLASTFVNNVTPVARVSGEACRIVALTRLKLASIPEATASAAYERLSEVPAVALLALVALRLVGRVPARWLWVALMAAVPAVAVARWGLPRVWRRLTVRWASLESIAVRPSALVATTALSGVVWLLDVTRLWLVARAFDAPLGYAGAAALSAIGIVAGWVPTVGGLGAVEGGLVAGLVAMGVELPTAIAITALERAISFGLGTLSGFGALSLLGGRSLWRRVTQRADRLSPVSIDS